jgi:hypothetical protein
MRRAGAAMPAEMRFTSHVPRLVSKRRTGLIAGQIFKKRFHHLVAPGCWAGPDDHHADARRRATARF